MYTIHTRGILIYSVFSTSLSKTFIGLISVDYDTITATGALDQIVLETKKQIEIYIQSQQLIFKHTQRAILISLYDSKIMRHFGNVEFDVTHPLSNALQAFITVNTSHVVSDTHNAAFKLIRGHLYEATHEAMIQLKLAGKQLGLCKNMVDLICIYIWSTRRDEAWSELIST